MLPEVHHRKAIYYRALAQVQVDKGDLKTAKESFTKAYHVTEKACGKKTPLCEQARCYMLFDAKCHVCKCANDADNMLLCNDCDTGWHLFCLDPPLSKIPNGHWTCPICATKKLQQDNVVGGGGSVVGAQGSASTTLPNVSTVGASRGAEGVGGADWYLEHAYEEVRRLKRQSGLRDKWLGSLLDRQGERCADSVVVQGGQATSRCPWGERQLPTDAAEVDHKLPLSKGGTDDKDNLQALCACCHSMKTHAERRASSEGLRVKQGP